MRQARHHGRCVAPSQCSMQRVKQRWKTMTTFVKCKHGNKLPGKLQYTSVSIHRRDSHVRGSFAEGRNVHRRVNRLRKLKSNVKRAADVRGERVKRHENERKKERGRKKEQHHECWRNYHLFQHNRWQNTISYVAVNNVILNLDIYIYIVPETFCFNSHVSNI